MVVSNIVSDIQQNFKEIFFEGYLNGIPSYG